MYVSNWQIYCFIVFSDGQNEEILRDQEHFKSFWLQMNFSVVKENMELQAKLQQEEL